MSVDLKDKEHRRLLKMVAKDYKRELRKEKKKMRTLLFWRKHPKIFLKYIGGWR